MSRRSYDLSKFRRLEEIDTEISKLQKQAEVKRKFVEQYPEVDELEPELQTEVNNAWDVLNALELDISDLEAEYADLEEETYEEAFGDYKYDQWKDSQNEEE